MKKSVPFMLAVAFGFFASPSCSKKSSNNSQPKQTCELTTISAQTSTGTQTITFSYDDQGRVVSVETVDPGYPDISKTYTYTGNMVIVNEIYGGQLYTVDTVTLNSSGQIETDHTIVLATSSSYLLTYTFSGGQVQQVIEQNGTGGILNTETYTWSGGNVVTITDVFGTNTVTNNYSYNNQPAQAGDYWSEYQLIARPVAFIKAANMVTGITGSNGTTDFYYSTDSTGKISGISETGQNPETDTYQWSCH